MKVVSVVLNNFTNDSRVLKESLSLSNSGYEVIVVALHSENLEEYENLGNYAIHRLKLRSKRWLKIRPIQLLKYFEFVYKAVKIYRDNTDIVHCNDLNALVVGFFIKLRSKNKIHIVYDAHEYETERDGMNKPTKALLKFIEQKLMPQTSRILTVSDSIANCYTIDYGIKKPALVLNCPVMHDFLKKNNILRRELNIPKTKKIFLYQGGLKSGRGIELLVEAFTKIDNEEIVIVFMGSGPLEKIIKGSKCNNIYFHKAVSPDVLLSYTNSADYGILFYEDTCLNHRYCSPNKIFEYFMAEIPVIVSNLYEMKRIVEKHKVGVVAIDNSVGGFLEAVRQILVLDYGNMQNNLREIKKIYNWNEQEKVLLNEYISLQKN